MAVAAVAPVCAGCGDSCTEASDKTAECGIITADVENEDQAVEVECSGAVECAAECVIAASCEDLQNRADPDTKFSRCVAGCDEGGG